MLNVQEHHWCSLQCRITLHHQPQGCRPEATRFSQLLHISSSCILNQACNKDGTVQMQCLPRVGADCNAGMLVCRPDALHWHHCTVLAAPEAHHKQASRHTTLNQAIKQAGTQHPGKQAGTQQVVKRPEGLQASRHPGHSSTA